MSKKLAAKALLVQLPPVSDPPGYGAASAPAPSPAALTEPSITRVDRPPHEAGQVNAPMGQVPGRPKTAPGSMAMFLATQSAAMQIDVIDIYTTDAKIDHLGLRVLEDDRKYFPRYDAVVLYKLDLPKRLPKAWAALQALEGKVDEHAMIAMNARAELQGVPFDQIARDFIASTSRGAANAQPPEARRGFVAKLFGPDLWKLARQHLLLVALSVGIAILVGVPIAILVFPHVRLRAVVLGFASLLQTVPSLALLAVLISMLGAIGALPALIALTLYSLLPIMRNTVTGLAEVPNGLRLAGTALGMTPPMYSA